MTQTRAQVDKLLTQVSNKYVPTDFLCERILPSIGVAQDSGLLGGYGKDHIRVGSYLHVGGGKYKRVNIDNRNTTRYFLEKHALSTMVTEEDKRNVEDPFNAEIDATNHLTSLLWTEKEVALAAILSDTAILTNNKILSGSDQYNDEDNSNPLADFVDATSNIADLVGQDPNIAIMSLTTSKYLKKHPQILDRLGYKFNMKGMISDQDLAHAMGVEEVLIGKGLANFAKEGQNDTVQTIWGKDIVFAVAPKAAKKEQISLGYRIVPNKEPRRVKRIAVENPIGATEILADDRYQQLISNVDAAFLIKDAIA